MKKLLSILLLCFCFSASAQNSFTIQQLLDEGLTVVELLDAGLTPEEFYGVEYAGGLIFDVDTILGICKSVAIFNGPGVRVANILGANLYTNDYPLIETLDDGLINTQLLADLYDNSAYDVALNLSHKGYNDWYIPSTNEALKLAESYINNKFRNDSGENLITEWNPYILTSNLYDNSHVFGLSSLTSSPSFNEEAMNSTSYPKFIRKFSLDSISAPGSPALQSFLETYTPPVSEDEVVSNANSFDVLNPLSYNGEFESVYHNFDNGDYIVPNGKSLIVNQFNGNSNRQIYINDVYFMEFVNSETRYRQMKSVICSPGDIISLGSIGDGSISLFGVLINKNIQTIHHDLSNSNNYSPEAGMSAIVQHLYKDYTTSGAILYFNEAPVLWVNTASNEHMSLTNDIYVTSSDILSGSSIYNDNSYLLSMHGVLINNSNYTHATDYELIDALNEGMDSLSTMSEMIVLENDSISSQNAILTEENEALMEIDYNFDSLQYVADFLSSQVFELQQELLVPNIDVDMAIGWNMVGFSCPQQKNAEDALINIVDEVIIFKDNSGNVYMPEFSFNGIGDLTPGHGYQLKVTDYILDFNICE